jgi:hypothetical protein
VTCGDVIAEEIPAVLAYGREAVDDHGLLTRTRVDWVVVLQPASPMHAAMALAQPNATAVLCIFRIFFARSHPLLSRAPRKQCKQRALACRA